MYRVFFSLNSNFFTPTADGVCQGANIFNLNSVKDSWGAITSLGLSQELSMATSINVIAIVIFCCNVSTIVNIKKAQMLLYSSSFHSNEFTLL